jgi:hypothetical protein
MCFASIADGIDVELMEVPKQGYSLRGCTGVRGRERHG